MKGAIDWPWLLNCLETNERWMKADERERKQPSYFVSASQTTPVFGYAIKSRLSCWSRSIRGTTIWGSTQFTPTAINWSGHFWHIDAAASSINSPWAVRFESYMEILSFDDYNGRNILPPLVSWVMLVLSNTLDVQVNLSRPTQVHMETNTYVDQQKQNYGR